MKIGLYNPYYDGLGGGERYTLTLAAHWSVSHDVSVFWDDPNILSLSESRFGIDLSHVRVTPNVFKNGNIFEKLLASRKYDLIFFLSDGSIPATLARHNILHFQVPFASILTDPWKMGRYDAVVCNSQFTKNTIDAEVGLKAMVIYPPVPGIGWPKNIKKKKQILSVGRFTNYFQAKKQEVLLNAFAKVMQHSACADWEMIFAGGLLESDKEYFMKLQTLASGLPVKLLPNISNEELVSLYRTSSLYWHAAGFGETNPVLMEHFGIATVEAMSAGAVPLVYAAGGQTEIVVDGVNGELWTSEKELVDGTISLVTDATKYKKLQKSAMVRSEIFNTDRFTRAFDGLIAGW
jgi:glycosyltransferase involved in cell wall biosynthesis